MHIAIVSDVENSGGANVAAVRLTDAFARAGHRITRIYNRADSQDQQWDTRTLRSGLATQTWSLPARAAYRLLPPKVRTARHQRSAEVQLAAILQEVRPDVVSLHNLHIARWSPAMLRVASDEAPVVCTLHDTWLLTGRCINPGSCRKFITGCDASCPTATEYPALDPREIAAAWEERRAIVQTGGPVAVSPSDWLGRLAASGLWSHRPVFKIPLAIDLETFSPFPRDSAKQAMGIPADESVLLFCAADPANPKKGIQLLAEALRHGIERRVHLLLLGEPIRLPALSNVIVHQLGYVTDDRLRAIAFNCADAFVHPSIADNAPLTVIESLACGTPVVAFPIDGLPETVVEGATGWLAGDVSAPALRAALVTAFRELDGGADFRRSCRSFAESRYAPGLVSSQYESVFRHAIDGTPTDVRCFTTLAGSTHLSSHQG